MSYRFTNLTAPNAYTTRASAGCTYQRATQRNRNAQSPQMFMQQSMGESHAFDKFLAVRP